MKLDFDSAFLRPNHNFVQATGHMNVHLDAADTVEAPTEGGDVWIQVNASAGPGPRRCA